MTLFKYLLVKTENDDESTQRKARALIIILLVFIVVSSIFAVISYFTTGSLVRTIAFLTINLILLFSFVLLRLKGFRAAGNYFSLSIIIGSLISLNMTGLVPPLYTPYVSGFYILFGILVVTSLFSTQKTLYINVVLIIGGVLLFYQRSHGHYPGLQMDMQLLARDAIIRFFVILAAIVFSLDFILRLNNSIIKRVEQDGLIKNEQNTKLNALISSIKEITDSLKNIADEINEHSDKLYTSSGEQASNINEITETIEKLSNSVAQNSQNSQQTSKITTKAVHLASNSEMALRESIIANNDINDKIGIISQIAAKTDILSINASIEARRAGEWGKGFSVVAGEIRKLADISDENAKLIIQLAAKNKQASNKTAQAIHELIQEVNKTNSFIAEISAESQEQKAGIEGISESMKELNNLAQHNAQLASGLAKNLDILTENTHKLNQKL